jgi:hypothetical protein
MGAPSDCSVSDRRIAQNRSSRADCSADNHLTIDPALAVYPERGTEYRQFRASLRRSAFSAFQKLPEQNLVLVLTDCLGDNVVDAAAFSEHIEIARARGVPFLSFTIDCDDADVLRHRVTEPDRQHTARSKMSDPGK